MALKRESFVGQYLDELEENVVNLEKSIAALRRDSDSEEETNRAVRILHTIKGSSRMLKFATIEKLAHGLESVIKGVKEKRYPVSQEIVQLVLAGAGRIRDGAESIRSTGDYHADIGPLLASCERAYAGEPFDPGDAGRSARVSSAPVERRSEPRRLPTDESATIRVRTGTIDEIIRMLNNLIVNQFQFKKHHGAIAAIEELLEGRGGFDDDGELLKSFRMMRKSFKEQIEIIERDTFALQERIIGMRMFPLEMIMGSLPGMVEELAISLGKLVNLNLSGTDAALDRLILETIHDPIIHIVRNAVDHGIETPDEREGAGKPRTAELTITCRPESGGISISIADDGRGIDTEAVRRRACALYPARRDEIESMKDEELNALIFSPGFSTAAAVTALSGRGAGLDIVKHNLEKVKGRIFIESRPGRGTVFTLTLPLTLSTIDGYFVRSAGMKYFVPANYVNEVLIVERRDVLKVLNRDAIRVRDAIIPLFSLPVLLNERPAEDRESGFVFIAESLGSYIGVAVDSVLEYVTLIYKPLPESVRGIEYIQGIVFDERYDIVSILHMPALIERAKRLSDIDLKSRYAGGGRRDRRVLVVDDSLNSREIQRSILESAGCDVTTVEDGIGALESLRARDFDIVITDINMPRMDGFTLLENLKRDPAVRSIPVIVVSNYDDVETSRRALELGASSYIVKSDFDRNNLVETVDALLRARGEHDG